MALRMFGRMEEQAQHTAGEPAPTNHPWREKVRFRHLPQAAQRGFDGFINRPKQLVGCGRRRPGAAFRPHDDELSRERGTAHWRT